LLAQLGSAAPLFAQVVAEADVPLASPTGGGVRNLAFGSITPQPGQAVTVDVPAAIAQQSASVHSAQFSLNVQTTTGITIEVGTPAALTQGAASIPLSFNSTDYGAYCVDAGAGCILTNFNPATTPQLRICRVAGGSGNCHPVHAFPANSLLSVYVGGLLTVPAGQRAGFYTGTITLTIVQVH
jgi:hypothetical protein